MVACAIVSSVAITAFSSFESFVAAGRAAAKSMPLSTGAIQVFMSDSLYEPPPGVYLAIAPAPFDRRVIAASNGASV